MELPQYSPSGGAPSYAAEPQGSEERLALAVPSRTAFPAGSGTSIPTDELPISRKGSRIILEPRKTEDAPIAIYRQDEIVRGEVILESPSDVSAVSIRLEGEQVVAAELARGNVYCENILFSKEHELQSPGNRQQLPSRLEFAITFPETFTYGKGNMPTPPSFHGRYWGVPSIRAYVSYTLTAVITNREGKGPAIERTQCEVIYYRPCSSPPLPTPEYGPPYISPLKRAPEEWYHVTTNVPSRMQSVGPIDCHLFIPAGLTYFFEQEIPFQIQLHAPMNHLLAAQGVLPMNGDRAPVGPSTTTSSVPLPAPSTSRKQFIPRRSLSMLSSPPQRVKAENRELSLISVYLQRRLVVNVNGEEEWQSIRIGESTITSMATPDGEDVLVWDGRAKCLPSPNVVTSGFSTGRFEVKDYIVIHVKPTSSDISPWLEHTHAHPIQLVTHPYQGSV